MKNIFTIVLIMLGTYLSAQFKIELEAPQSFLAKEAYLYTLNGSKDMLIAKEMRSGDFWNFNSKKEYFGMMKVYFPENNTSLTLISENKNIKIRFQTKNNKVSKIEYFDDANKIMESYQDYQKKREQILPALYQMQSYYKEESTFGAAIKNEINYLNSEMIIDQAKNPFVNYYVTNYNKFLTDKLGESVVKNPEIINFINNTNNYLESSSLLKPLLMNFLSNTQRENLESEVDVLLKTVNLESSRGQTVLSELIEIFNVYSINDLKNKYINEAKKLKCTINDRLSKTIDASKNTNLGVILPNHKFVSPKNTNAKSIHEVKASKKIIVFWSSTCPHCEKEITQIIEKYNTLKSNNIEVIGLSLDSDVNQYNDKARMLPWINDAELKGWYSSYVETYNVHATPTFYIVDQANIIISKPNDFGEALSFLNLK